MKASGSVNLRESCAREADPPDLGPLGARAPDPAGVVSGSPPDPSRRSDADLRGSPPRWTWLPEELTDRPASLFVHGPSPPVVNLTVFAFAQTANPSFVWVNIRVPGEPPDGGDPALLGWIPAERLKTFETAEAIRPGAGVSPAAIAKLIAPDESPSDLDRLRAFLCLPDFAQGLLAVRPGGGRPGLIAVPNVHPLADAISPAQVEAIVSTHLSAGYSLFAGYPERFAGRRQPANSGRNAFDYVFWFEGTSISDWAESRLVCEKAPPGSAFHAGVEYPVVEVPFLSETFRQAQAEHRSGMPRP
jgi:hypothetical protein